MRRGGGCRRVLLVLVLAAATVRAGGQVAEKFVDDLRNKVSPAQTAQFALSVRSRCSTDAGMSTRCRLDLTNGATSGGDFAWTAGSSPSVAGFSPGSGTTTIGATSTVTVVVPPGFCLVRVVFTGTDGTMVSDDLTQTNGQTC